MPSLATLAADPKEEKGPSVTVLSGLARLLSRPVDPALRPRAARHVLDWLGTAALGRRSATHSGFAPLLPIVTGPCRVVGGARALWWDALNANAALGNILEMDDLHRTSILHPGPVIVPAAIAMAETLESTGAELLDAIVRGYEATIRIGRALGPAHYKFFHNTSSAGSFGAAAAAASLLKLDAAHTAHALANAGSRTGGLWQMRHEECETKSLHNVQAAQSAVQAALLARTGVRGPLSLLEGPQGLFAATAPGADAHAVLRDPEGVWVIGEVSFKPWPACRHAHPAIDAALAVRERTPVGEIVSVRLDTYRSAVDFCDRPHPTTVHQAKFSLQHAVAVSLIDGPPWLPAFEPTAWTRADVSALREKVSVNAASDLSARFPDHYAARITVTLRDGRTIVHEQHDALGDPECPLDDAAILSKAKRLMDAAGWVRTEDVVSAALALPTAASSAPFTQAWSDA